MDASDHTVAMLLCISTGLWLVFLVTRCDAESPPSLFPGLPNPLFQLPQSPPPTLEEEEEGSPGFNPLTFACKPACLTFCKVGKLTCANIPPLVQCGNLHESCEFICKSTCDCLGSCASTCQKANGDCTKLSVLKIPRCIYENTVCNLVCKSTCPIRGVLANYANFFKYFVDMLPHLFPGLPLGQIQFILNLLKNPAPNLLG